MKILHGSATGKRTIPVQVRWCVVIPQLSLTVLVENTTLTDRYFSGEPGLVILGRMLRCS